MKAAEVLSLAESVELVKVQRLIKAAFGLEIRFSQTGPIADEGRLTLCVQAVDVRPELAEWPIFNETWFSLTFVSVSETKTRVSVDWRLKNVVFELYTNVIEDDRRGFDTCLYAHTDMHGFHDDRASTATGTIECLPESAGLYVEILEGDRSRTGRVVEFLLDGTVKVYGGH
jgi:hypothetical protein